MTTVNDFLRENVDTEVQKEEVSFPRFKAPFVIKALTADENSALQKQATRHVIDKKTRQRTTETDFKKYADLMLVASIVQPDLNNEALQKSWGCLADPAGLLKQMLLAGEYADLADRVQVLSGFESEDINDLVDEAKN